jgi:hypothetical protein
LAAFSAAVSASGATHRIRARGWQRECYDGMPVQDLFYDELEDYSVLAMLFQMITPAWPAASEAWRQGPCGIPEVTLAPEPSTRCE